MAESYHFESLSDAGEQLSDALEYLLHEIGGEPISIVDAHTYRAIQQKCHIVANALADVEHYRTHFEQHTKPNDREMPSRSELEGFYASISGDVNAILSLGLEGSEDALQAMIGTALSHEDDELLASDDHLSHGAILVEADQPSDFLRKMESQLTYVLKGVASHFQEAGRSTSSDGGLNQDAGTSYLTDISYEGQTTAQDHTPQI